MSVLWALRQLKSAPDLSSVISSNIDFCGNHELSVISTQLQIETLTAQGTSDTEKARQQLRLKFCLLTEVQIAVELRAEVS